VNREGVGLSGVKMWMGCHGNQVIIDGLKSTWPGFVVPSPKHFLTTKTAIALVRVTRWTSLTTHFLAEVLLYTIQ